VHRYRVEASKLMRLATPVLIASVAQTGMGFVDTVMAGGVSATDMAAVSIAASVWLPSILFGIGILMALVPVVAQLNGSGRQSKIPFEIQQGLIASLLLSFPTILVLFQTNWFLDSMNVEPLMAEKTVHYMYAMMFAVPAHLLFQACRSFTDGMSLTKPAMVIGFLGLVANVPLNWIFVYGKFGAPQMGGVGCGVATAIVYWLMFFMLLFYVITSKRLAHIQLFATFHKPNINELKRLFKLGLPSAAALFFEVTLFAIIALLISPLGPKIVASHQIAINFSSLVFMLPMSLGVAVSIRVGHTLGESGIENAMIATKVGLIAGLSLSVLTATITVLFKEQIALMYTDNQEVIELAVQLLLIAAIYQFADSVQAIAGGALRGFKEMKAIFQRTFIAYWILGMPIGYVLAMTDWLVPRMGAPDFWYRIIIGLSSAAVLLGMRLHWLQKQGDEYHLRYN
jgi:multidrug resistance protein, MATE family